MLPRLPHLPLALTALLLPTGCRTAPDAPDAPDAPGAPGAHVASVRRLPSPATPEACRERRARVAEALGSGVLVLSAGEEPEGRRFQVDDDFQWLTGVATPDAVLTLIASEGAGAREVLYLHPKDERHELWNGPRPAPGPDTERRTGIAETRSLAELDADLVALAREGVSFHGTGGASQRGLGERLFGLGDGAGIEVLPARELLRELQAVRDPRELAAQRAAIEVTEEALVDGFRVARPGAYEFEVEAAIESGFRKRGASARAFPSICGSGPNSCTLHYRANERRLEAGDLLLMDVGAKLHHYCADVTRTIPVSGRFTERQREVYALVYEASRAAAAALRPGATLRDAHAVAVGVFERAGYERYFRHSVGHGLGMRVHDAPGSRDPLVPGMVVTIEPGLYLPEEELGVRIEDDYRITETGAERLSKSLPSHPDELEAFLARIRR